MAQAENQKQDPKENPRQAQQSNAKKNPDDWTTGGEPMTGAQQSYLKTLSEEAGEDFDDSLTKAEASKRIDALQKKTSRDTQAGGKAQS